MNYISVILIACILFPFLAAFISLPFAIYNYHKYGSVPILRIILVFSFVLYLLIAYFLIILPLPSFEEVINLTTPIMQLIPFNFIKEAVFDTNAIDIISFLKQPVIYQGFYNLLLTLPFGMFLRYYFKKDLKETIIFTFLLSLFFELTQLSGLYFIYPRAYRLFDIDDLIVNTSGGVIGYLISPLFMKILPSRDKIDEKALEKGKEISIFKRIITFILDLFFLFLFESIIGFTLDYYDVNYNLSIIACICFFILFIIVPSLFKGRTFGYMINNMMIVNIKTDKPCIINTFVRNIILYFIYMPFPFIIIYLIINDFIMIPESFKFIALIIFVATMIFGIILGIIKLFLNKPLLYEKISNTRIKSTINKKIT